MRGQTPKGIQSQIYAIGGGNLRNRETFTIDQKIVQSVKRTRAWSLAITAASSDSTSDADAFGSIYGDTLLSRTDYLRLIKGDPNGDNFARKIARSEIVYVADGDARLLLDSIRKFQIEFELRRAFERGIILCGVGAGAVCWGKTVIAPQPFEGLGFIDINLGLTRNTTPDDAQRVVDKLGEPGYLLDDLATLHFIDPEQNVIGVDDLHRIRRFDPGRKSSDCQVLNVGVLRTINSK